GFWPAAILGVLAALAAGLIAGIPALRVQSHYLGIVSLGLAIAFLGLVSNSTLTGGSDGVSGIPAPSAFGLDLSSQYLYYYLEAVALLLGICFAAFITRTRLGRRLRAMRDDQLAAASIGAEVPYLRIIAFALGGLYGGLAGALYAGLIGFVAPASVSIGVMFFVLAMVMALQVEGITRRFRGVTALDDVTLTVRAGDIYGIVGPNGSGKTTLFNVISGLHPPERGRVAVCGRDVTGARPQKISRMGVA